MLFEMDYTLAECTFHFENFKSGFSGSNLYCPAQKAITLEDSKFTF